MGKAELISSALVSLSSLQGVLRTRLDEGREKRKNALYHKNHQAFQWREYACMDSGFLPGFSLAGPPRGWAEGRLAPHLQLCNQSQPTSPHSLSLRLLMGEHKRTIIQSHQPAMAPEVLPQAYDHYKKLLLRVGSWQTSHRKDGKKEGLDRKDRKCSCCVSYFLTLSQP